jgi:integrase
LVSFFDKKYINKSLQTKDFTEAKTKADIIYSRYINIVKVMHILSREQIQQIIDDFIKDELEQDLIDRAEGLNRAYTRPEVHSNEYELLHDFVSTYKEDIANGVVRDCIPLAKDLLLNVGIEFDEKETRHNLFLLLLKQSLIRIYEEQINRNVGQYNPKYLEIKSNGNKETAPRLKTLDEAYDTFISYYKRTNIKEKQFNLTINKLKNTILPFFQSKKYVAHITLDDIEEFKEFLETFPNINKKPYKSMSFEEIVNLDNVTDDVITVSTQEKYLKIVKQFFNYLMDVGIITINPCLRLIMPNKKDNNREPFSKKDIDTLFTEFESLDDRKLIYYTLAYTGMRPSELWKASIEVADGIAYFDLTKDGLDLKTKTSRRKIPLHKKLLELGIDTELAKLQHKFKQAAISNYFNKNIIPLLEDSENKVMYSFRHTVATELKRAEVNMDKVSELLGHRYEGGSITKDVYASTYTLQQLQEAINHLQY